MAKLVDALDLGSCGATRKSSSLFTRTTLRQGFGWQATFPSLKLRVAGHTSFAKASGGMPPFLFAMRASSGGGHQ